MSYCLNSTFIGSGFSLSLISDDVINIADFLAFDLALVLIQLQVALLCSLYDLL